MKELESGLSTDVGGTVVTPRTGVLCDSVGAGKSYTILSLIASSQRVASVPEQSASGRRCGAGRAW